MVGTHINRNITWAEQASPFMTYIARVSFMLQQGNPVADLPDLLPEGAPSTMPFWAQGYCPHRRPATTTTISTPTFFSTTLASPRTAGIHIEGSSALPDGMSYRVLVLPPIAQMTPEVLHKLHDLVAAGAVIVGSRPKSSPSLLHYPDADTEVQALATDLWGDVDGVTDTQHAFGKGMIYSGLALDEVLSRLKDPQDFASGGGLGIAPAWIHRRNANTDIYFVANQADTAQHFDMRFRASGKSVQIWRR